ncbi:MAG: glutamate--tRNA ligase family protein, partial [Patescibacteria group bacterium]
ERTEIYKKYLEQLLEEGKAYWCYCAKEDLEAEREAQMVNGRAPKYGGHCRPSADTRGQDADKRGPERINTQKAVIRFLAPEKEVQFQDLVRGKVQFDMSLAGDFVIAKSLETPLYNFSATVDDFLMEITHVIRGEDHLANTPKQILIQEALGFSRPEYAHLPLILNPDRSKLSKRIMEAPRPASPKLQRGEQARELRSQGAEKMEATIRALRERGYLPEAVLNFLLLLGWNPGNEKEVFSLEEAVAAFDFKKVQKGGAIFNEDKLDWFNAHYIRELPFEHIYELVRKFIPEVWKSQPDILREALRVLRERMKRLTDFQELAGFFFELSKYPASRLKWKTADMETTEKHLENILEIMEETLGNGLEERVMAYAEKHGRGEVLWPLRVALSGLEKSPGP